ncbi:MAG TPA: VacJ family lipoprotein [Candidatus Cybelea sp.]|nr:VacJ family lipoprotein [Candidatus Cybelea sp.]
MNDPVQHDGQTLMSLPRQGTCGLLAPLFLAASLLAGCATPPTDPEDRKDFDAINDPLEPTNRFIFGFNQTLDHGFIRPIALAYRGVVPEQGRLAVHNVVTNLREPWIFANDVLQGEIGRAGDTLGRFVINSTIGIAGIFDVAGSNTFNMPYHDNDAGITLAKWGIGSGPYLVLPILGPSNPRDAVGIGLEYFLDPVDLYLSHHNFDHHHDLNWAVWTRTGVEALDTRTNLLDTLDNIERTSLDYYSALRSISRQRRDDEIHYRAPVGSGVTSQQDAPRSAKAPQVATGDAK